MSGVKYYHFDSDEYNHVFSIHPDGKSRPFIDELAEVDIIVNGILQDTDNPFMFVSKGQDAMLKPRTLIIDVSCDLGMGFWFACAFGISYTPACSFRKVTLILDYSDISYFCPN